MQIDPRGNPELIHPLPGNRSMELFLDSMHLLVACGERLQANDQISEDERATMGQRMAKRKPMIRLARFGGAGYFSEEKHSNVNHQRYTDPCFFCTLCGPSSLEPDHFLRISGHPCSSRQSLVQSNLPPACADFNAHA